VPQTKPETGEDAHPLVLPELPTGEREGQCHNAPSERTAMIFRLSQELAQKIKIAAKVCIPLGANHLPTGKPQCLEAGRP
jgi:hypothetical protein